MRALLVAGAAAGLGAALTAQDPPVGPPPVRQEPIYDPTAGMDPDGRIERPVLPPDITHPERWRYTPAGRIKPGNVFERFLVSSFVSPIVFREQDIGTGGGFALTDVDFRNQNYRELANILMTYTSEGQQAYRMNWRRWLEHRELDNGGIIREERSVVSARIGYEKTLTRRFFGFGSETLDTAETSYTEEVSGLGGGVRISVPDPGSDVIVAGELRYEHHGLSAGRVEGVPTTGEAFAEVFRDGDGDDQLWLDFELAYDSRDSLHQPYRGFRAAVAANSAVHTGGQLGSILAADLRWVLPLPPLLHAGGTGREENPPTDVFAVQLIGGDTLGDLPFYSLPTLGGTHTLRGFIQNRFTDRAYAHGSLEYRFGVIPRGFKMTDTIRIERIGIALFYDFGTVAGGVEDLADGKYLDSYGIGLRVGFSREASFRVDLGFSDEDTNLTLAFGSSF